MTASNLARAFGVGTFFDLMKHKKFKRFAHKQHTRFLRDCGHDPGDLRRRANDLRIEYDLCRHSDDERNYTSPEDAAADLNTPGIICEICGKEKLRVQLISPRPIADVITDDRVREAFMKDLLR